MKRLLAVLAAIALVAIAWGFWWEPRGLVVREAAQSVPSWRGAPLRIGVVSDLHVGAPYCGVKKLRRVINQLNAGRPDVIVLLGDYVIHRVWFGDFVTPEQTAAELRALKAPLGVYAVLGNHDWWLDAPRIRRDFEFAGIRVIDDRAVRLERAGGAFWLAGISDYTEGPHDVRATLAQITDDAPVIAMTHNPDVFPEIPPRVALTLAGHTHGGQVALPVVGALVVPSRYGSRYAAGAIVESGRHLYVTTGVGTSLIPVRFGVPPEIVFIEVSR
ncbi:MAG: metallophosphoesterase [Acidobacteriota bacterium]|nr:metallophosphoesterase [Acidobacteriota bacterium]